MPAHLILLHYNWNLSATRTQRTHRSPEEDKMTLLRRNCRRWRKDARTSVKQHNTYLLVAGGLNVAVCQTCCDTVQPCSHLGRTAGLSLLYCYRLNLHLHWQHLNISVTILLRVSDMLLLFIRHFEDSGVNGRIILTQILEKLGGSGVDVSGWGYREVASSCEYGNEHSGSTKRAEFLD